MADDYLHGAYANQQQSAGSRLSSNRGRPGFSAYEIAVQHGFEGSEEDWLASLVGNGIANTELNDDYTLTLTYTDGTSDTTGSIRGEQGIPGIDAEFDGEELVITEGNDTISDGGEVSTIRVKGEARVIRDRVTEEMACSAYPTETVTGDIVSITDGADDIPVKALSVAVEPVQDLHGQDAPYPAGGGKNKFYIGDVASTTASGVTYAYNAQNNTLTKSGTSTGSSGLNIATITVPSGTYTFSAKFTAETGASTGIYLRGVNSGTNIGSISKTTDHVTLSLDGSYYIRVATNEGLTGGTISEFQLELGSSATAYAPYSNICPITGWDAVNVVRCGKNLLENVATSKANNGITYTVNSDGTVSTSGTATAISVFWVTGNLYLPYTARLANAILSGCPSGGSSSTYRMEMVFYNDQNTALGTRYDFGDGSTETTVPEGATKYAVCIRILNGISSNNLVFKPMIRSASDTDSTFEPYSGITYPIPLPSTVYGGTLDVSTGVMTVDRALVDLGTLTWSMGSADAHQRFSTNGIKGTIKPSASGSDMIKAVCSQYKIATPNQLYLHSYDCIIGADTAGLLMLWDSAHAQDTSAQLAQALSGVMLAYELAEPYTITLDPVTISTLLGNNTIYADAGQVSVAYRADVGLYIDKRIAEVQALVLDNE